MNILLDELQGGLLSQAESTRAVIRLLAAMLLGAIIGFQREQSGKPAGVRTHMLVSMGSTLFVLSGSAAGMEMEDLSRIIQGLATGIGFIGAGAILKHREEKEIEGLTTAAGLWMTSAAGVAVGLGQVGLALLSAVLAWITLSLVRVIRGKINKPRSTS